MVLDNSMKKQFLKLKKTITVSGTSGTTTFLLNKAIAYLIIQAPNITDTFKAQLLDADSIRHTRLMSCRSTDKGSLTSIFVGDGLPNMGTMTLNISEATSEGDYTILLYYKNK